MKDLATFSIIFFLVFFFGDQDQNSYSQQATTDSNKIRKVAMKKQMDESAAQDVENKIVVDDLLDSLRIYNVEKKEALEISKDNFILAKKNGQISDKTIDILCSVLERVQNSNSANEKVFILVDMPKMPEPKPLPTNLQIKQPDSLLIPLPVHRTLMDKLLFRHR